MTDILLLGGPKSGKSTLVGGLIKHLAIDDNGQVGYYDVVREYDVSFETSVIDQMDNYHYPSRTSQHVVRITISDTESLLFPRDEVLTVFDFGGEYQLEVLGTDEQILDVSSVDGLSGLEDNEATIEDEFRKKLDECKGIIFLMNLNTYLNVEHTDSREYISPSTLQSELVRSKEKNALVVTATDLIDYHPNTAKDSLTTTMFDNTLFDEDLFTRLNETFRSPRMMATLRVVANQNNFDLFGISVPPGENEDTLAREGNTYQTEGFETLVKWILK